MLPLCSSDEVIRALERLGAWQVRSTGKHLVMRRELPGGRIASIPIPLAKREIPRPTLRNILKLARVSEDEFLDGLRS